MKIISPSFLLTFPLYSRFSPDTPIIRIGRMQECEIKMNDGLLSKYQGSIKYVPNVGWTLYDGYNEKTSTNGNWLYLNEDYDLYHGMHFKANHTLFEVNFWMIFLLIQSRLKLKTGYNLVFLIAQSIFQARFEFKIDIWFHFFC